MRKYSRELKIEAIRMADAIGPKKTCERLGINPLTLVEWRTRLRSSILGTPRRQPLRDPEREMRDALLRARQAEVTALLEARERLLREPL